MLAKFPSPGYRLYVVGPLLFVGRVLKSMVEVLSKLGLNSQCKQVSNACIPMWLQKRMTDMVKILNIGGACFVVLK